MSRGHCILSHGFESGPEATKVTALADVAQRLGWTHERPDYTDLDAMSEVSRVGDVPTRLRRLVADDLGISPDSVDGYMMGEHGMAAFPVLSHLSVAGIPAARLGEYFPGAQLDSEDLAERVDDAHWVATNRLEGDFPGGVVDLAYRFTLRGDRIAGLHIAP